MQHLKNFKLHNLFFMHQKIMHFKSKKTPEKRAGV